MIRVVQPPQEGSRLRSWQYRDTPSSSDKYVALVSTAISPITSFLISPKDGDLTTQTLNVPRVLLRISVVNASVSISSQIINSGLASLETNCKVGSNSLIVPIFLP